MLCKVMGKASFPPITFNAEQKSSKLSTLRTNVCVKYLTLMTRTFSIRPWQDKALNAFFENNEKDFLCVATPGAGKTTFALVAARKVLATRPEINKIVVVVPSAHLKEQWADAAAKVGLILDTSFDEMTAYSHGLVTTYQAVSKHPGSYDKHSPSTFVIFDEIHHAGDEKSWGAGLLEAFIDSPLRLSLSGTPFRSDTLAIPFVRYVSDELVVDYEYGYDDALADGGVVRPVHFRRLDGHMEWIDTDGEFNGFSFAETIDTSRNQQRLKAALDPKGNWLSNAIARAHAHLQFVRRNDPKAGGLVICSDHKHAKAIAKHLQKLGTKPTVVLSDDVDASQNILNFAAGDSEWIVAVRMVSEGVDIPRLCVGLFATSTTTELFFRQAVGRIVRKAGKTSEAMMFIPNDPRLVSHAQSMAHSRIHSLKKPDTDDGDGEMFKRDEPAFDPVDQGANDEQLSMFQVLSSTPIYSDNEVFKSTQLKQDSFAEKNEPAPTVIDIELPPLPLSAQSGSSQSYEEIVEMRKSRATLRQANTDLVHVLSGLTNETHAVVNSRLNKLVGIQSIAKASNSQLEKRKKEANNWISSLRKKRVS